MVSERNLIRIRTLDALLRELEDRPAIERKPFLKGMALAGRERVPSIRTYYRWRRVWLASGRDPESLRDRRQFLHGGKRAAFDPEALAFFCQRFLSTSKPTATRERANGRSAMIFSRLDGGYGNAMGLLTWSCLSLASVKKPQIMADSH